MVLKLKESTQEEGTGSNLFPLFPLIKIFHKLNFQFNNQDLENIKKRFGKPFKSVIFPYHRTATHFSIRPFKSQIRNSIHTVTKKSKIPILFLSYLSINLPRNRYQHIKKYLLSSTCPKKEKKNTYNFPRFPQSLDEFLTSSSTKSAYRHEILQKLQHNYNIGSRQSSQTVKR